MSRVHNCELFSSVRGYGHECNTEPDSDSTEEEDSAFHKDWIQLGNKGDVYFSLYPSVDSLSPVVFSTSMSCALIARVGGAVKTEANVNQNQCQVILKCTPLLI